MTDTIKQILGKSGVDIVTSVRMASESLNWTGELFRCIKEIAKEGKDISGYRITTLAAIGDYLSNDFANLLDCERGELDKALSDWEGVNHD